MSAHADTIRNLVMHYVPDGFRDEDGVFHDGPYLEKALAALDALLAENQRLRDALERIASGTGPPMMIATLALAGDTE